MARTCQLKAVIPLFLYLKSRVRYLRPQTVLTVALILVLLAAPLPGSASTAVADNDEAGPVLVDSAMTGVVLDLVFDEMLDENHTPAASSFTVRVSGETPRVLDVLLSGDTATLIVRLPVQANQAVEVSYTPPSMNGAAFLQDGMGNAAAAFSRRTVTNNTPVAVPDDVGGPVEVDATWSLRPADIGVGGRFRLIFVTSEKNGATSQDIADYDWFIRRLIASGHADIREHSARFRVLGSTSSVFAREHAGTDPKDGPGEPIYWLNGPRVAGDNADFYDDSWQSANPGRDESGASVTFSESESPWTGTSHNGRLYPYAYLGHLTTIKIGRPDIGQGISRGEILKSSQDNQGRLYGISPIFEVVAAPEIEVSVAVAAQTVDEDAGSVQLTVELSAAHSDTVGVRWATSDGTAVAGSDYTAADGTLSFAAGERQKTISVAITDDSLDEGSETFTVTLSDASNAELGAARMSTVTINDDDTAEVTVPGNDTLTGGGGGIPEGSYPDELRALLTLYGATGGSIWQDNTNWGTGEPLDAWYGVTVDSEGRVIELDLGRNGLSGAVPVAVTSLTRLRRLYLNDNELTAVPLAQLQALVNEADPALEELALWGNGGLSGLNIPDELGKRVDRAALRALYEESGGPGWREKDNWLDENNLFSTWYGVLANDGGRVTELDLAGNGLTGELTNALTALSGLERLDLSGNAGLRGELPLGLTELAVLGMVDIDDTGACAPEDSVFGRWLSGIDFHGETCAGDTGGGELEQSGGGGGGCAVASPGRRENGAQGAVLNFLLTFSVLLLVSRRNRLGARWI